MITKEQAITLRYRQELWHLLLRNSDGTPLRVRVNGVCKTWKTRPAEFQLPVKHGLRDYLYVTHKNAHEFVLPEEFKEQHFNVRIDA